MPAALLAWASVLLGIIAGWQVAAALAVVAAAAVPLVCRINHRAVVAGLLVCLVTTAGFSVAIALRAHAVVDHPLSVAVHNRATAQLRVQISDDPKLLTSSIPGAPPQVLVRAELRAADGFRALHGAVVLLAPARDWAGLLPGQEVTLSGQLGPPRRADLTVAAVQVRGSPTLIGEPPRVQRAAGLLRAHLHDASPGCCPANPAHCCPDWWWATPPDCPPS